MQPTTEKITVSQNDYNNLADWAKPSYQVQTQTAPTLNQTNNQIQQTQPQASLAITPQSLQQTPQIKIPSIKNTDTTSAGIVASTQPSVQTAQENYNQVQQATGTQAQDAQSALQRMAENIFGQKADAQANQVNLENLAGIQEQQKALGEINTSIASEQVALRGEQEKVRQGYATEQQKQISQNTLNDTYGRRLADLAIRQSAANQNITSIRENADRQTKLLTAPLDTKIQYLSSFAKDNVDFLTKEQQNKLAFISDDLKSQKQDIQALQQAKTNMITEIAKNGGGTNQELIRRIQSANNIGEVSTLGAGSGFIGALDRQQLAISRANLAINQQELKMKLDANKPINVSSLVQDPNAPAEFKNNAVMLALIKSNKIGEGAKTSLSSILGVNKALEDLAQARQYTPIKGISPFNVIADVKIPFTDIGIPFREAGMQAESVQNRGYLDAINLKVQQWASGASLTKQQTDQVNRLTPKATDTDANVRIKMNNLTNFMNQQVAGTLASQGVEYIPEKVNLFESRELYNKASPEQKAELDKIINQ
jgi:hypothetical protein